MLKSALSVCLFCLLGRLDCKDLTVKRGENATLECFSSNSATEVMIEWKKTDSHPAVNVIVFKDEDFADILDDSFKARVKPKYPNWKETKDFTVNLTHVIMNDAGIYQCKAAYGGRDIMMLNTINLTVESNHKEITALSGEKVTLPCQNPNNDLIIAVRWSRADLEPKHILSYQEGKFNRKDQDPSFTDRVDLQEEQMKDGDVSLSLKNVTDADAGKYECRVIWKETNLMKRADLETEPICIINLSVAPAQTGGTTEDGFVGMAVGLSVFGILVLVVVGFGIYRKCKPNQTVSYKPPTELQSV